MPTQTRYDDPRLVRARALAADQAGVVARRQLYALGVTRWQVKGELRARRWRRVTDAVVAVHNGPLDAQAHRWAAVLHGGPRARLDGVSALVASGLARFEEGERIRVSVPRGARVRRTSRYNIRQTRRWRADDLAPGTGVPRTKAAVAAVHGALWARSARQADLILTMTVQQGLARAESIGARLLRVRRHRRRAQLHATVLELVGGVGSLHELDVVRGCRARGFPEPDRQVVRRNSRGSYFLDFRWSGLGVVLEVDGIQHAWVENLVADALRHNEIALEGDLVLRLPVMGLRACPDEFFGQLGQALYRRGWRPGEAA